MKFSDALRTGGTYWVVNRFHPDVALTKVEVVGCRKNAYHVYFNEDKYESPVPKDFDTNEKYLFKAFDNYWNAYAFHLQLKQKKVNP